ncbi:MAG: glycoside hydrolase family 28 protein [Chitinophagaceae bacterium]|nr:MAG: glycoside hydrolase family 28 protein [Chitinophagaceae bacterium]
MKNLARRNFIKTGAAGLTLLPALGMLSCGTGNALTKKTTEGVPGPANKVNLNVKDFGVKADGFTKDTTAIQQAIDRCAVLGGGEVRFPAGNYFTGALQLRSKVMLRLEKDAVIMGSPDFADYPITQVRWEGKWIQGHIGLIYAFDVQDSGIIGPGKIAGNHALGGRPNEKYPFRHPALIEPINCTGLRFEGFATDYYLMWSLHPTYCQQLVFKDLYIRSTGGNGDGIDLDSCKHVVIAGCDIATGDDCISLKSGRGMEGYSILYTTEDVLIKNCTLADSIFACIGIGSETSGGIRNVRIENCKFVNTKTHALYIKSRPGRGAFIEDIIVSDIEVSGMKGGLLRFNILASGLQDQVPVPGLAGIPTIKNFQFKNIKVQDVPVLVEGTGIHPDKPLDGFVFENISGTCAKGISLANIKNARLKNINVTGYEGPLLSIHNVQGSGLEGAVEIEGPKLPPPIMASGNFELK